MRRNWIAGATAAIAAAALLGASPATAAPTGALGGPVQISTAGADTGAPSLAVLPDGTTAALWLDADRATLRMRIRPAGSTAWGYEKMDALPAGTTVPSDGVLTSFRISPLGPSRFLAVWIEESTSRSVHAAVINPAAPTLLGDLISGSEDGMHGIGVSTNAAGRAVVTWTKVPAESVYFQVLPSPLGTWSAPYEAVTTAGYPNAAVASDGSFCITYLEPGAGTTMRGIANCHPATVPTAPATWLSTLTGATFIDTVVDFAGYGAVPIVARGTSFMAAATVGSSGELPLPSAGLDPSRIRVLTLASATASGWGVSTLLGSPGELNMQPQLQSRSNGTVMLTYSRYEGAIGGPAGSTVTGLVLMSERSATGVWSAPAQIRQMAGNSATVIATSELTPARTGDNGAILVSGIAPWGASATFTTRLRRAAGVDFDPTLVWNVSGFWNSAVISPAGRATVAVVNIGLPGHSLEVRTSSLPKPVFLARSKLSAAPRRGAAVACRSAVSEARWVSVRWTRNGYTITGATSRTYTPRAADVGSVLRCRAIATNATGVITSTSLGRTVS